MKNSEFCSKSCLTVWLVACSVGGSLSHAAIAEQSIPTERKNGQPLVPEVIVLESSRESGSVDITPGASAAPAPDAMEILSRVPGASVNRNGALSGQAQYRGLYGPRMTVTVDKMHVTPGGPNWMDSPLHYLPAGRAKLIRVTRGIAPVSAGPGFGGLVEAESKASRYGDGEDFEIQGDITLSAMESDGEAISGLIGAGNQAHRVHIFASREEGDDYEFADGVVGGTGYERDTYGFGYGFAHGDTEINFDYGHTDTGASGTPALPLDIRFFDTDRFNFGVTHAFEQAELRAQVYYTDVSHGMDNFTLRTAPDFSSLMLPPFLGDDKRLVDVESDALGFNLIAALDAQGGELLLGVDGNFETHDAQVTDPDFAPFFVNNFNDATQDRVSVFAEWSGDLSTQLAVEVGLRYSQVESDAGAVDAFPARLADMNPSMWPMGTPPFAVRMLRERFNAQDRRKTDDLIDGVIKFDYRVNDSLAVGFGYGRKTRAPSYVERYLWIPLEVNAGLGDLNNYVGNVDLEPEESDQIELSMEWSFSRGYVAPRFFYRAVDNFIQGEASSDMVTNMVSGGANGDPTPLQFANVDAVLYGFDMVARYELSKQWVLDATVNYVRGERDDIDDNLYRIAPLNGRLALTYANSTWSLTTEAILVDEQDKLSQTIVLNETRSSNATTPGYGLLNIYGEWRALEGVQLRVGVENLLDKAYTNHLAGFNRTLNSDVPVGQRLPGKGRNLFAQVAYTW